MNSAKIREYFYFGPKYPKRDPVTESDFQKLPGLSWLPSRIPVRDALATFIPKDGELKKKLTPSSYEQRWRPEDGGGVRLLVPYDGGSFDSGIFHIEAGAWDRTTCDWCNTRIPAMTLCYVTKHDPYIALCENCYRKHVVNKVGLARAVLWRIKKWRGLAAAA